MDPKNLKVWEATHHKLKIIAAHRKITMVQLLDLLAEAELARLKIIITTTKEKEHGKP